MNYGYIPNEMTEKEFRWECVNYALYHYLKKVNSEERLNHRLEVLLKIQESQLIILQQMGAACGRFLRNYPSHFASADQILGIVDELLSRENELFQEYRSYRIYFLSSSPHYGPYLQKMISNKRNQIQLLNELTQCFPNYYKYENKRQEYFLEEGYRIEKVVEGLTFPTVITFDDRGNMYLAEAGYAYGAKPGEGRILKVDSNGETEEVAGGFAGPVTGLTWNTGNFYIAEGGTGKEADPGCGKITKLSPDGEKEILVSGLRSCGDHFTGDIKVGPDKKLYFTVGTATNSAIVGMDNLPWIKQNPQFHDTPARDYVLNGQNFLTRNPLDPRGRIFETGAFKPFGAPSEKGEVIKGELYANGVIYRSNLDGSDLQVFADGFRNPFGLEFSPFNGKIYLTDNGADHRGSRPINHDWDNFWEVKQNGWYGWPDFFSGLPATLPRFHEEGEPKPSFLIKNHPELASQPIVRFEPHSSSNKFSFSTNYDFGFVGEVFVGQLGGMDGEHGMKVVRVNIETGQIRDFYINKRGLNIQDGPKRPVAATFNPKGDVLYVVDFGLMGPREKSEGTGSLWRIMKS